jgi:hypothetical protein
VISSLISCPQIRSKTRTVILSEAKDDNSNLCRLKNEPVIAAVNRCTPARKNARRRVLRHANQNQPKSGFFRSLPRFNYVIVFVASRKKATL